MAEPNVLQEYIVNKTITIKPSDWNSDKKYYDEILGASQMVLEWVILVKPTDTKLYLQNGIKAELGLANQMLTRIQFTAKTVPTKNIVVNVSIIKDTNK